MKRKDLNETSCCGEQMWLDNLSWFDDEYEEYVCHKCGNRKLIKRESKSRTGKYEVKQWQKRYT